MSTLQRSTFTPPDAPSTRCQRAAAVVYRTRKGRLEFLLVSRSSDRDQFVLPAGGVDQGESLKDAALRECLEESGVKARLEGKLTQFNHVNSRGDIKPTRVYLATMSKQRPSPEGRDVVWARHEDLETYRYDIPEPTLEVLDLAAMYLEEYNLAA